MMRRAVFSPAAHGFGGVVALVMLTGCPSGDGSDGGDTGSAVDGRTAVDADSTDRDAVVDGTVIADTGTRDGGVTPRAYACSQPPMMSGAPELPRVSIDTTFVAPSGRTVSVAAGASLQAAIDAAQPGDTLMLAAGAEFAPITLPNKVGDAWIVIRSAAPDASLPAEGTRVTPAYAPMLPRIVVTGAVPAVQTASGAHHYRFIGVEFRPAAGVDVNALIDLGSGSATDVATLAHHIIIDRCYVHGDPRVGGKRGIQLNSATTAIIDSYVSDWKRVGQDTQAIGGWNGPGPFRIVNNYLEGAGENILLGGADARIPNLIPTDIEICHNHFAKPLSWKDDDPSYAGTHWSVKNLFELKVGRRVLFADNILENCWGDAQTGYAIVLKSANQDGSQTWAVTEHVTLVNNLIRHAGAGVNMNGVDPNTTMHMNNVRLYNNLFVDIGGTRWRGDNRLFQILNQTDHVTIQHATGGASNVYISADGAPSGFFVFRDNAVQHGEYGLHGSGSGDGTASLTAFFPGAQFDHNLIIGGGAAAMYPPMNFFPADDRAAGFVDASMGNFRLAPGSMYVGMASDGTNPGAEQDRIETATAGVIVP